MTAKRPRGTPPTCPHLHYRGVERALETPTAWFGFDVVAGTRG